MNNQVDKFLGLSLIAQEKLQSIICSIPGKKHLVLEGALIKPMEHVCSASWLRLKGIQRIFKFDAQNKIQCDEVLVFMISSRMQLFKEILNYIHELLDLAGKTVDDLSIKKYHIICVPSCFSHFSMILEAEGLFGKVQLHRFNWDFIVIDDGILSMETPFVFPTVFSHKDTSILTAIAQSIRILKLVTGEPDLILAYGAQSSSILKMLKALGNIENEKKPAQKLDILMFVDRDKDYASSLLTPAIYAGLLLEVFDMHAGELIVEKNTNKILRQKLELFLLPKEQKTSDNTSKNLKIKLNSKNDDIYAENRFKHFTQVSGIIRNQAKNIAIEAQKLNDMKLEEMHEFVARKLPKVTEFKAKILRHLNACEQIIEQLAGNFSHIRTLEQNILNNDSRKKALQQIDELLTVDGQKYNTLRLLCLLHLSAGIVSDELAVFIQNYCNYFGPKYLYVFQQLAAAGLLPELQAEQPKKVVAATKLLSNLPIAKFQQTEFQANANRLRLMATTSSVDDDNKSQSSTTSSNSSQSTTNCPSYVFNGMYIPLIAQLCAMISKFSNSDDLAMKLGMLDMELHVPNMVGSFTPKGYSNAVRQNDLKELFPLRNANFFVMVVGGVTYAEIAACKLVESVTGAKITVASDSIISGSDLIESVF